MRTLFQCQHPYARRRTYTTNGAVAQVCYSCYAVRSIAEGHWQPVNRVLEDGNLHTADGTLIIPGYWAARDRAPV